jgi:hypothetical protein
MPVETDTQLKHSSLLHLRPDPVVLIGYFMQNLMLHFSDSRNIEHPSIRQYTWSRDTETEIKTGIYITPLAKFDAARIGFRPAIVIKRAAMAYDKDVIGGRYLGPMPPRGLYNNNDWPNLGQEHFEYPCSGKLVFYCIHRELATAELIGTEVMNCLLAWRPIVLQEFTPMYEFMPKDLDEGMRLEESKEHWAVPVVAEFAMRHRIVLRPAAPLLKAIGFLARPE